MTVYILLLGVLALTAMATGEMKDSERRAKIIIIVTCSAMFLIQALRGDIIGTDLKAYLPAYHSSVNYNPFAGERQLNFEFGYVLLTKLLASIGVSDQLFLAIVAAVVIIPIGYTWIENTTMPAMSVFIYITFDFFLFTFSGLRQSIALSIAFFSYRFIKKRKFFRFLICIVLAALFHKSAIFFILAYPLYAVKIKSFWYCFIVPAYAAIFVFRRQIFSLLYRIYRGDTPEITATNAYTMLLILIAILFISYIFPDEENENVNLNAYRNFTLIAIGCQIFGSLYGTAIRVGYYYLFFLTLFIPEIIAAQKDSRLRLFAGGLTVAVLSLFFWNNLSQGYLDTVPYSFFWE